MIGGIMFKNYLKIAIRNLIKYKRYSLINILGLAIGLACFMLIVLWVQDELSYDRFHKNANNIYLVLRNDFGRTIAATSKMLYPALIDELPEVIDATAFAPLPESFKAYVEYQGRGFEEMLTLTEPQFFSIFSFDFKEGDPQSAFNNPNSIIMTERMCQKYFGENNALGESMTVKILGQERILKVTGILKNMPYNSHFQRELYVPIDYVKTYGVNWDQWQNQTIQTFIQTQGKIDMAGLEKKILECKQKYYAEEKVSYSLLPLKKIHLHANNIGFFASTGDIKYVYIFSIIAGIILLIATMNYMNLSNALSLKRAKEIGIQKVVGAQRITLMRQYFGETFLLTIIALGWALIIVELTLPVLNRLAEKTLSVGYLSIQFFITIFLTILITSIISGVYPALFISGFQPIQVLKGKYQIGSSNLNLRKGLIIFQFALSIMIIICTLIVFSQLNFIQNTNLGFDKENVVCLRVKGDISSQYNAFKNTLLENPNILSMSRSEPLDASSLGRTEGVDWAGKKEKFNTWLLHVDDDFAETYKIDMQAGRFYSKEYPADETNAYVLNEAAVDVMGIESPVGKEISVWGRGGRIVGVAQNFHFNSLHHAIEPLIFRIPDPEEKNMYYREISIRFISNSIHQNLTFLIKTWKLFFPAESLDYYFFDERLNVSYHAEQRMGKIFKYFSFLAIFIACLGLYGLTAFTIEQKVKDIGVHKVLGATVSQIVFLLSKNYIGWILFANVIAWPVAYLAMNKWLENFAYRVAISWWVFILASLLTLVIALFTVSWQAFRAARTNPVEALRYE
jgi:putative ABC transport system permease protein